MLNVVLVVIVKVGIFSNILLDSLCFSPALLALLERDFAKDETPVMLLIFHLKGVYKLTEKQDICGRGRLQKALTTERLLKAF